jgi:alpha-ketoglutarate-dependent taurine dioxygenase
MRSPLSDGASILAEVAERGYYLGGVGDLRDDAALQFSSHFGEVVPDARDGRLVKTIAPSESRVASRNTLSSRYGYGAFPFHTDTAHWRTPARLLVLICVAPGGGRRPTRLIDTRQWRLAPDEAHVLANEVWVVREVATPFYCTALSTDGHFRVNFDCMSPAVAGQDESRRIMSSRIEASEPTAIEWEAGCALVIDNRRMLHARGAARMPDVERKVTRLLVR